jgi:hypothetical protein
MKAMGHTFHVPSMANSDQTRDFLSCECPLLIIKPSKEGPGQFLIPWERNYRFPINIWLRCFIKTEQNGRCIAKDSRVAWESLDSGVSIFAFKQPAALRRAGFIYDKSETNMLRQLLGSECT